MFIKLKTPRLFKGSLKNDKYQGLYLIPGDIPGKDLGFIS